MMLIAIMIVGMRDSVNIVKDDDDSDDWLSGTAGMHKHTHTSRKIARNQQ